MLPTAQPPGNRPSRFLKNLGDGKVGPDRLTPALRRSSHLPGKDVDAVAKEWLEQFKGATFTIGEEAKVGAGTAIRGLAKFPDKSMAFSLRLVNGQYRLVAQIRAPGHEIKVPADPSMAAAQDVVRNFLDLLLGGDLKQAHCLMTPAWKKSLSPPGPQEHSRTASTSGLVSCSARNPPTWKDDYLSYTLATSDNGSSKDTVVFVATLDRGQQEGQAHGESDQGPAIRRVAGLRTSKSSNPAPINPPTPKIS